MQPTTRNGRALRRRWVVAGILAVGWTVAAAVYVATPSAVEDDEVYEMFHSRRYTREVERMGGKAGLLASDLDEWLAGLWAGKARAYTIAAVTALVAGAYVLAARALASSSGPPRP